jgi:hypothetical protein
MRQAPALLALQPSSPLQIPAKLYEYVAMGRPLLVVGGEGATSALVEKYRLGRCCPDRADDLERLLRELGAGGSLPAPDAAARSAFGYRQLTGVLAHRFDAIVSPATERLACA